MTKKRAAPRVRRHFAWVRLEIVKKVATIDEPAPPKAGRRPVIVGRKSERDSVRMKRHQA